MLENVLKFVIYCDGAAAPTNPGPSSLGVVVEEDGEKIFEFGKFLGHGTNQTAELSAAIHGLQSVPVGSEVLLVSDSQYVIKGLTEWRKGWEAKGWRNSQKKPIANQHLWMILFREYDQRTVTCQWVRGHNGHPQNERCDELATQALVDAGVI